MNINDFIDELIIELAYRLDSGIPDLKNQNHLSILSDILTEWGMGEIEGELLRNILKEEDEKEFKNPLLNKVIKYKTVNGDDAEGKIGNLLRRPEKEDAHIQAVKALGGEKSDEYTQAMDSLGGEGQPNRDIDKEREAGGDKGGSTSAEQPEQPQQNVVGTDAFSHAPDVKNSEAKSDGGDQEKEVSSKLINREEIKPQLNSVSDINDELSDGEIKQMALNFGTKNKEKFKPAPGNVSSMTAEILSGEAKFHLDQNPNMSDDELTLKLYNQIKDTELGKELGSENVSSSGKYAGYNKDLLSMLKSVSKSGRKKWERNQKGIENLKSQGKLSDPMTTRSYYGHEVSIQKQMELIESVDGPFYTKDGFELPKDVLLTFIKNSGGGENPSDTSTITVDEKGRAMVSFHSDKISLSDIQANSTPNQEAENAKKIVEESNLPPQIKEQSNQIISQGQDLLNQKENELEQAANQPARELANGNISQILNDIKSDKGITGKAKVSDKLKSLLFRGNPHPNLIPYLPQQEEQYTEEQLLKAFYEFAGDDNREGEMTSNQLKLLYRSTKQQGYDISANLGKIREESLEIQRNTHRKLNEMSITLPNGDSKSLGDYIEAKNIIDKLHIGVIDGDSGEGVGKYPGLFDVNMGGIIVEPEQLKTCLDTDNTDDFITHFEVGTPEKEDEVTINKETGQITGRNIFVYAVTKGGKRIKVAYKTQRSKAGESGKLQTTYQWDKETQKCFEKNQ
jgi:hypothetical protein